jgi:methyl-accepting chemotaxis protein
MKILKLDSISKKLYLLITLIIITSLVGISAINYAISKRELLRSNQIILKNAIESTMVEINKNYRYTLDESQWMTEEVAKNASLATIGDLINSPIDGLSGATSDETDANNSATVNSVYADHSIDLGESGYFFIVNSNGDIVSHPFLSENIYNLKSHDGRFIVQEIIDVAKSGGGILNYALEEDVSLITDSKTVFSKYFPHWDWVVGAVIYDNELARGSNIILSYNMIGILLVLAISLFLTIILTRKIIRPINKISKALSGISNGDLTVDKIHIKTKDEMMLLGGAVNKLIDSLNRILRMMIQSSDKLSKYASNLYESSGFVSQATTEVANAISQMAVQSDEQFRDTLSSVESVTLLGESIKETADASIKIGTVVERNVELKEMGLASVQELKDATKENNENTSVIESLVHRINNHSNDIGEITTIISNIAKQTNLLALNASIEASRAGEHGMGFAVVAEEIRSLANETSLAVEDIRQKIEQMQGQSVEAVDFISKNREGVDRINETVNKTGEIIGLISDGLQNLIEDINAIVEHNKMINSKKDEILEMLNNVSDAAQDNSAAIEEISATAEEQSATILEINNNISQLNDMVNELNSLINEFKVKNK